MNTPTDEPIRYDFEAIANSMNGFDEIAIERMFSRGFKKLDAGTLMGRAILFVQWRRDGMKDTAAYQKAMLLTIEEMEALFTEIDDEDDEGKAESGSE